ncbi:uncharacterized protein LOC131624517 [Vicia villosa]|uniref:uncharacterized protein LOC131624517 n=1 Tax=Vicia villosa TaxID=3911 RepID=UPI00273C21D0|nr:uncharacterized protein LOC131624517 [Vicia villosa]
MAENTRMKGLEASINGLNTTMQQMMEDADARHNDYIQHRHNDMVRFEHVEAQLGSLQLSSALNGSGNSDGTPRQSPFQIRNVKLDFPRFDGTEVLNWIFKVEQFFDYYSTPDNQRLTIAAVHLDKDVVPWYQMITRNNPFRSWGAFTRALELEYGPSPYESPRPTLFKLTQTSTISEYYSTFISLANRSHGLSPDAILDCFVSGLKTEIHRDVIAQNPTSLSHALSLAKLFAEKYNSFTKPYPQTTKPIYNPSPHSLTRPTNALLPTPPTRPQTQTPIPKPRPIRSITSAEIQLRRDKGQCFYCDDKFTPNHRCPNKHYLLLQVDDFDSPEQETEPPDGDSLLQILETEHHLSFNALNGAQSAGTLRFQGQIQGIQVQVLLDSGSSDNFLQPRIAQCLKLPIQQAPQFQILVGNGSTLTASGLIQDLPVTIQGHNLHLPVYLLPITGADLVLGAPWLKTLGPHIADYDALLIKFYLNNKFITLRGDQFMAPGQSQFHHIRRLHNTHSIDLSYTLQFHSLAPSSSVATLDNLPEDLAALLRNYWKVFEEPNRLPPPRLQDHSIPLIDGSNPVKVKPYRYPHSQKTEIERLVSEMLQQGIIQPSTSPFSSPVLLVRKKDGSWRFCTDYRALNAITIKDSFPIPTVDELLDELFGAAYFSKLDLRAGYHQIF